MNDSPSQSGYGALIEPATFMIQRLLPGGIERVWAYLTDSNLRRQWLAAGDMGLKVGAEFELIWRNDELTTPSGLRPAGFGAEQRMQSCITDLNPPHKLTFTWGEGDVTFELEPKGDNVLLSITHRRLPDREMTLMVGAGWHMHLDILAAQILGTRPEPFWDGWTRLKSDYEKQIPA
jgi:uncharacterized protein YndB with AHSA1/START domain